MFAQTAMPPLGARLEFQPHHRLEAALTHLLLDQCAQVLVRIVIQVDLRVARQPDTS